MTSPSLDDRLQALAEAARILQPYVPPDTLTRAAAVREAGLRRQRLGSELTVVALAGSTGSGKSSLLNALVGLDVAQTGVRRPTTAHTMACVWDDRGADALLDWLGVAPHRRVARRSVLDEPPTDGRTNGLVLLDLPDHDSMVSGHRDEVDRLVSRADVLVWVTDPIKYADAVLHEEYLSSLRRHGAVVMVLLNKVDQLGEVDAKACLDDLSRLTERDGLADVDVRAVSAVTGLGVPALLDRLHELAAGRSAAQVRAAADAAAVADDLAQAAGLAPRDDRLAAPPDTEALVDELVQQWQIDARVQALGRAQRARAEWATRWPWHSSRTPPGLSTSHHDAVPAPEAAQSRLVHYVARSTQPLPAQWGKPLSGRLTAQSQRLAQAWVAEIAALTESEPPAAPQWGTHRRMQRALLGICALALVATVGSAASGLIPAWVVAVVLVVVLAAGAGSAAVLARRRDRLVNQWGSQVEQQARERVLTRLHEDVTTSIRAPVEQALDEVSRARRALRVAGA